MSRCFVILLLAASSVVSGQDSDPASNDATIADDEEIIERTPIPDLEPLGVMRRSIVIVDDAQRIASERFGSFMGQVDGFFSNAGTDDDAVSNESWARIRIELVRANGESFKLDNSVKVRAVLPRTERKLKLLISTEDDDSQEPGEVQSVASQGNQNASLALRFLRSARKNSDVNIDIGVRKRNGAIQYFGRVNSRFDLNIGSNWVAKAANNYYHYSKTGFENRLSFDFRRLLYEKDNLFFRTYTDFSWERGQKGAIIGHTTGLYWQLDARRSLALEGSASYHTALNEGIGDRFRGQEYRFRWRHNVWRPWFFYEVWPSVAFPSTTRYRRTNGLFMRIEMMIGENR